MNSNKAIEKGSARYILFSAVETLSALNMLMITITNHDLLVESLSEESVLIVTSREAQSYTT